MGRGCTVWVRYGMGMGMGMGMVLSLEVPLLLPPRPLLPSLPLPLPRRYLRTNYNLETKWSTDMFPKEASGRIRG